MKDRIISCTYDVKKVQHPIKLHGLGYHIALTRREAHEIIRNLRNALEGHREGYKGNDLEQV